MAYDRPLPEDPPAANALSPAQAFDRWFKGRLAALTGGQSPWAASQAWEDWAFHLATSPGRRAELATRALVSAATLAWTPFLDPDAKPAFEPAPEDRRFRSPLWRQFPYNLYAQTQLALEDQWRAATESVEGASDHHLRRVRFLGQFVLNALAPINNPAANPEVIEAARSTGGFNFLTGAQLYLEDLARLSAGEKLSGLEAFEVGKTLAVTPGEVVYRNDLMEVIQYAPMTAKVRREPVLIVPAWIMKYYILDLTPETSMVRHLLQQGFTVFVISWRNPGPADRDLSLEDYRVRGVDTAIDVVRRVCDGEKIHAVGYCLGGTTLAISAAAAERDRKDLFASLSLLAAQTDFEDAGELMMFIDESQLALLEDMMSAQGYLDARQMAGAFYALRTNEMLWSQLVARYLEAKPKPLGPLDAWLADSTRMPARMHSDYLRRLFLHNSLADGQYEVGGRAVALKDIRTPMFALGAERDHIAPWRSVYKIELFGSADTTFVLSGGGHNTSVVSPPGKPGAYYRVRHGARRRTYLSPEKWLESSSRETGSWWPCWTGWLKSHGADGLVAARAPAPGSLGAAPGQYVFGA